MRPPPPNRQLGENVQIPLKIQIIKTAKEIKISIVLSLLKPVHIASLINSIKDLRNNMPIQTFRK